MPFGAACRQSMSLRSVPGFIITAALLITIAPASLARFQDKVREQWNARLSAVTSKCTTHGHFKVHHPLGLN